MTLDRQPNDRDLVGALSKAYPTTDTASGVTTIGIPDTTGIKVGMIATNPSIPAGTKVATVNSTSIVLAAATTAVLPQESTIAFTSDYKYTLQSIVATANPAVSVITVTGVLKIDKYGRKSTSLIPDGNLILQPKFLTIT